MERIRLNNPFAPIVAKSKQRLKERMLAGALSRKGKYFRRPLHVNGLPTSFRVVKLKTEQALKEQLRPLMIWPESECFVLPHVPSFDTFGFASPCDVVVTDRSGRVTNVVVRAQPGQKIDLQNRLADVWCFPPATSASLQIAIGTTVSTKDVVVLVRK